MKHLPAQTTMVVVETIDGAGDLRYFEHPQNATYMFGRETDGIRNSEIDLIKDYFNKLNRNIPKEYIGKHTKTAKLRFVNLDTKRSLRCLCFNNFVR